MADVKIRIIGEDKASAELNKIDKSFKSLRNELANISGGIVAAGLFVDQVMKFGEAGAKVQQTSDSFALLLDKIGASPDLLSELQAASKDTISDMELMNSTSLLLAGTSGELATELANSTPELLEIAKAAEKLNPSLGDTTFLYDSLSRGIKRASPLILDNLGLVISIGDANEKYAESIGKAVSELTVEEEKIALLNAVLDQGNVLIEQAGGNVDSATDSFSRLNTAIENSSNALKEKFAPFLADAAEAAATLLTWQDQLQSSLITHEDEVALSARTYDEYRNEMSRAAEAAGYMLDEQGNLVDMYTTASGRPMQKIIEQNFALTQEMWNAKAAAEEQKKAIGNQIETYENARNGANNLTIATEELKNMTDEEKEAVSAAAEVMEYSKEQIGENKEALEQLNIVLQASAGFYKKATEGAENYTDELSSLLRTVRSLQSEGVDISGSVNLGGNTNYSGSRNYNGTTTSGSSVTLNYSPFVSTASNYEAEQVLRPIIEDVVRSMR